MENIVCFLDFIVIIISFLLYHLQSCRLRSSFQATSFCSSPKPVNGATTDTSVFTADLQEVVVD